MPDREHYLVIIDGAGDYEIDFNVLTIVADTPAEAVEKATSSEMGYGRDTDGKVFVVRVSDVSAFLINESHRKVSTPVSTGQLIPAPVL